MAHPSRNTAFNQVIEAEAERNLWATVLLVAINDAKNTVGCSQQEHLEARSWFGQHPSRHFRQVCNLAGLDADAAHRKITQLLE